MSSPADDPVAFRSEWRVVAMNLFEATLEADVTFPWSTPAMRECERTFAAVADRVLTNGGAWDDDVGRALAARFLPHAGVDVGASTFGSERTLAFRCVKAAHRRVSGIALDPEEEALLSRTRLAAADVAPPASPSRDGPVTFAMRWSQDGRIARANPTWVSGTAAVDLDVVHPFDAPVVCRLARPDSGWLDLRLIDGVPHRPVLAPGTWEPIGEGAFRAAAAAGVAWADDPFLGRPPRDTGCVALEDVARPPLTSRPSDRVRFGEAVRACLARAGHLAVVDGIVHRSTAWPTLHLVRDAVCARTPGRRVVATGRGGRGASGLLPGCIAGDLRIAWRLGDDLDMLASQDTLVAKWHHADWQPGSFVLSARSGFPVGDLARVARLARTLHDVAPRFGRPPRGGATVPRETRAAFDPASVPVRDVDANVFPQGDVTLLTRFATWMRGDRLPVEVRSAYQAMATGGTKPDAALAHVAWFASRGHDDEEGRRELDVAMAFVGLFEAARAEARAVPVVEPEEFAGLKF